MGMKSSFGFQVAGVLGMEIGIKERLRGDRDRAVFSTQQQRRGGPVGLETSYGVCITHCDLCSAQEGQGQIANKSSEPCVVLIPRE